MAGPWLEGVDVSFESAEPPGDDVEQALTSLDRREFVIATPLAGRPITTRVRALDLPTDDVVQPVRFLGARPTSEIERLVDDRLRAHAAAAASQVPSAGSPRRRATSQPVATSAAPSVASSLPPGGAPAPAPGPTLGPPKPRGPVSRF